MEAPFRLEIVKYVRNKEGNTVFIPFYMVMCL